MSTSIDRGSAHDDRPVDLSRIGDRGSAPTLFSTLLGAAQRNAHQRRARPRAQLHSDPGGVMRGRYLVAITWNSGLRSEVTRRMATCGQLRLVFARGPMLVFATSAGHQLKPDGIVLGTYFSRTS